MVAPDKGWIVVTSSLDNEYIIEHGIIWAYQNRGWVEQPISEPPKRDMEPALELDTGATLWYNPPDL
jgi:hypothetical protein